MALHASKRQKTGPFDADLDSALLVDQQSISSSDQDLEAEKEATLKRGQRANQDSRSVHNVALGKAKAPASNSSLYSLQIRELLENVKPKEKRRARIDTALRQVKDVIESVPGREALQVCLTIEKSSGRIMVSDPIFRSRKPSKGMKNTTKPEYRFQSLCQVVQQSLP